MLRIRLQSWWVVFYGSKWETFVAHTAKSRYQGSLGQWEKQMMV